MTANVKFGNYKSRDLVNDSCDYISPSIATGTCNYYINRFKDFMRRHKECMHTPPVYYYGGLRDFGKLTDLEKLIITVKTIPTTLAITGRTDAQKNIIEAENARKEYDASLPSYIRNGKKLVPSPFGSYGYKYCDIFTNELLPKLSVIGQAWLKQVRLDLQNYMEQGVVNLYYISTYNTEFNLKNGLTKFDKKKNITTKSPVSVVNKYYKNIEIFNTKFQSFAFATHPDAYNPKMMSKLPVEDLIRVLLTPDMKEWLGSETWEQAWIMAKNMDYKKMSKSTWDRLKVETKEIINNIEESFNKEASNLKKQFNKYWDEIF